MAGTDRTRWWAALLLVALGAASSILMLAASRHLAMNHVRMNLEGPVQLMHLPLLARWLAPAAESSIAGHFLGLLALASHLLPLLQVRRTSDYTLFVITQLACSYLWVGVSVLFAYAAFLTVAWY